MKINFTKGVNDELKISNKSKIYYINHFLQEVNVYYD